MEIKWINRYSQTEKADKMGRWARVGYLEHKTKDPFKSCEIAWIHRIKGIDTYTAYVYLGSGRFENDFKDLDSAKKYCSDMIIYFKENYID